MISWLLASALAAPALSYQGVLIDDEGYGLQGEHDVQFAVYLTADAELPVWEETLPLTLSDGAFLALLGDDLDSSLLDGRALYLEVSTHDAPPVQRLPLVGLVRDQPVAAATTPATATRGTREPRQASSDLPRCDDGQSLQRQAGDWRCANPEKPLAERASREVTAPLQLAGTVPTPTRSDAAGTFTAPARPEVACRATMGASGPSRVDPDGPGPHGLYLVYCEQELAEGGWTLLFQTGATTDPVRSGGRNSFGELLDQPLGSPHPLRPKDSYSLGRRHWPTQVRELLVVQVDESGEPDLDDAYVVHSSSDLFPDASPGRNIEVDAVCTLEGDCDTTGVIWRWSPTAFFPQALCSSPWTASAQYRGTFAVCPDGLNSELGATFSGDRYGYGEMVLWGFKGNGYATRVYAR